MTIDWFTFTAQIINFLILIWLLNHFLYRPIVTAMGKREKRLAATVEEARVARIKAEEAGQEYHRLTEELAHAKEDLLAETGREVEHWRADHLRQARVEVDQARRQWFEALDREKQSFIREARQRIAGHVHQLGSKLLQELADTDLESRCINVFLRRLGEIDTLTGQQIVDAIQSSNQCVYIESGFPISDVDRAKIVQLLQRAINKDTEIKFRETPELIFGIELRAAGHKLAWSAREQLEQIEMEFIHSLDEALYRDADEKRIKVQQVSADSS